MKNTISEKKYIKGNQQEFIHTKPVLHEKLKRSL